MQALLAVELDTKTTPPSLSRNLSPEDKSLICKERHTDIHSSETYVIDLNQLHDPDDAKRDVFGKWLNSGSHTIHLVAWEAIPSKAPRGGYTR